MAAIHHALNLLARQDIPLIFCVGYTQTSRLVAARHIRPWTAVIKSVHNEPSSSTAGEDDAMEVDAEDKIRIVFSRRWRDIHGDVVDFVWRAAFKAVYSILMTRPGISEVRRHLRFYTCRFPRLTYSSTV